MTERQPDALLGPRLRDSATGDLSRPAGDVSQLLFLASQEPLVRAPAWPQIERALTARPERRSWRWVWPAIALTSLMLATTATAGPTLWRWLRPAVSSQPPPHLTPTPPRHIVRPAAVPVAPLAPRFEAQVPRAARQLKVKPRAIATAHPPAQVVVEPAAPSLLAEESRLLGDALTALRKHNNPALALQRLDEYAHRFPEGELAKEAQHTKVQALLMQKRSAAALTLLDAMTFSSRARDMEALTLRGELRAQVHRCVEAQRDFAVVLSVSNTGASAERALFGRATCLLEQGQTPAARATLQEYLQRFPGGLHEAQAKRALGR